MTTWGLGEGNLITPFLVLDIIEQMSTNPGQPLFPRRTEPCIEVVDQASAVIMRRLSGTEKIRLACTLGDGLREMMGHFVQTQHPTWSAEQVGAEVARRVARDRAN